MHEENDEIDLLALAKKIWDRKWLVLLITAASIAGSIAASLVIPNTYRADVLLAPVSQDETALFGGLANQLGGLASLAGVDLAARGASNATLAIETIKSREFITTFIERHDLLIPLFAAKGWSRSKNEWIIDETKYNTSNNQWVRDVSSPKNAKPSSWEAYHEFNRMFSVNQDKKTGLVRLSLESYSPFAAKEWLDWLVNDANSHIRLQDTAEAKRAIEYLQQQATQTPIAEMQKVFYQLIEQQTKTILLAEVRKEYAFKIIDPAVAPEEKVKPKRSLIVAISTLTGGLIGISLALILPARGESQPDEYA